MRSPCKAVIPLATLLILAVWPGWPIAVIVHGAHAKWRRERERGRRGFEVETK